MKSKPNWLENLIICQAWKSNYTMNDSKWDKTFALEWGLRTKYVTKPHYCHFTDGDHRVTQTHEKLKKSGKETYHIYDSSHNFIKSLKNKDKQKPYKETRDEYGNKVLHYK